ncbi:uncharacterized protein BXZ73DRAFT_97575 [Epithele typhae]|uniref:uncharacterized protein n=1 Tax=Epithele typhae TaxID=378194 RepID=UPI0020088EE4|nr:uncharacterized protein BXZ73DRAFT_97575 [Epithele typhae]KAH9942153.1 hypothetical protein BXZ73DRAFT_97575 [Epithele typhae]
MFRSSAALVDSAPPTSPKQALIAVVQVWLDRLQTMAVITTFFVSIDSMLYSFPAKTRDSNPDMWTVTDKVIMAFLGGAIILHVCASILAYVASFLLIRYRLTDAEQQEQAAEQAAEATPKRDASTSSAVKAPPIQTATLSASSAHTRVPSVWDWEAHLDLRALVSVHQVRPWGIFRSVGCAPTAPDAEMGERDAAVAQLARMVRTLSRCHSAAGAFAVVGFVFALVGALGYFWTGLPRALGIFASACLGVCVLVAAAVVV